jgi:ketosteroid isomerase-like protein
MQMQVLENPATRLSPSDVVRAVYAAYNRGELEESRRYLAPDLEWVLPASGLHGEVLRGPDALMHELKSELEAFSQIQREPLELQERGDQVVGIVAASVRGRASGIELEERAPHTFTVRDGLIVRAETLTRR